MEPRNRDNKRKRCTPGPAEGQCGDGTGPGGPGPPSRWPPRVILVSAIGGEAFPGLPGPRHRGTGRLARRCAVGHV